MAIPIFLQTKAGIVKGTAASIPFQVEESTNFVYSRWKNLITGEIIASASPEVSNQKQNGIIYSYDFPITVENQEFLSETMAVSLSISIDKKAWSIPIIVTMLSKPTMTINTIHDVETNACYVTGDLSFAKNGETDYLEEYRVIIKKAGEDTILESSAWLDPIQKHSFSYEVRLISEYDDKYDITIDYRTNKGYNGTATGLEKALMGAGVTIENNELDNSVYFYETGTNTSDGNVVIIARWGLYGEADNLREADIYLERTSSESNYTKWDVIQRHPVNRTEDSAAIKAPLTLTDRFLNYNTGYKYRLRITYHGDDGKYYSVLSSHSEVFYQKGNDARIDSEDGNYVTVRFDPTISSYKYNIKEAITPTIGGQYPVIRRNGNQKYRTFQIGGLISTEGEDLSNSFIPLDDTVNYLDDMDSIILKERYFRERILEFLLKDEIKLYRSLTEGMMLIRLSNISLTPNQTLGRRLWSFTAQATEVADYNHLALQHYGFTGSSIEFGRLTRFYVVLLNAEIENGVLIIENQDSAIENGILTNSGATLKEFMQNEDGSWVPVNEEDELISFTVKNNGYRGEISIYQCSAGMTWEDFVNSDYNLNGAFRIWGDTVIGSRVGSYVQNAHPSNTIEASSVYEVFAAGGDFGG